MIVTGFDPMPSCSRITSATQTHFVPPLGSQPVPPLSAYRRLLAVAPTPPRRAPAFALAAGDLRNATPMLPENRRAHRGTQIPHQDRLAFGLSTPVRLRVDCATDHRAGAVIQAACAAE